MNTRVATFITELNRDYLTRHTAKEELFWTTKMGISQDYEAFNAAEGRLNEFRNDTGRLAACRDMLAQTGLSDEQKVTLEGWIAFFKANVVEEASARAEALAIIERESALALARRGMELGYIDPKTGEKKRASSVELALKVTSDPDEAVREACFRGLESIETYVLEHGFLELVKARNHFAKGLGYADYYDYKVQTTEGMSKDQLFVWLDDLVARTDLAAKRHVDEVVAKHGEKARKPWFFRHLTQGDAVRDLDPYMPFSAALERWGKSFAAMGISYERAVMQLDLVQRQGKYENGFCHAPVVTFEDGQGRVRGAINFTSNAVAGQMGSGKRAAETLFHEGGHAAHFANILMGAPCFSQEFAPTSTAFAETQSMFCDSLLDDADWLVRYAKDKSGKSIPWELIEASIRLTQPGRAGFLRNLLMVCYGEKALYECSDAELTPENVMARFVAIERKLGFIDRCPRPTLAVPHLLAGESSCIYHGYVLALAGVAATRHFFLERDGYLTDNPKIGPTLREAYWRPGNRYTFADFVARLTGKPFSMDALVEDVSASVEGQVALEREQVERQAARPLFAGKVELDGVIRIVHGAEVIATTENESFEGVCRRFAAWVESMEPRA